MTDVCVFRTVLAARGVGPDGTVVESGCRGFDRDGSLAVDWAPMRDAGVRR